MSGVYSLFFNPVSTWRLTDQHIGFQPVGQSMPAITWKQVQEEEIPQLMRCCTVLTHRFSFNITVGQMPSAFKRPTDMLMNRCSRPVRWQSASFLKDFCRRHERVLLERSLSTPDRQLFDTFNGKQPTACVFIRNRMPVECLPSRCLT